MFTTSFEQKLERAEHHINLLEAKIRSWIDTDPYSLREDFDSETGDDVVSVKFDPAPFDLSVIIGDCLYNLRSSLDHLVHALALRNKPTLSDEEATETAFPIFTKPDGFEARGRGRIKHLAAGPSAIIKRLQPCSAKRGDPVAHPLWILEKLQNIDKHRRLLLATAEQRGASGNNPLLGRLVYMKFTKVDSTEDYTEFARYRFVSQDGGRVKVNMYPTIHILFNDIIGRRRDVVGTLRAIRLHIIGTVFPEFYEFL